MNVLDICNKYVNKVLNYNYTTESHILLYMHPCKNLGSGLGWGWAAGKLPLKKLASLSVVLQASYCSGARNSTVGSYNFAADA